MSTGDATIGGNSYRMISGISGETAGLSGLADDERPRVYYAALSPLHTEGRDSMMNTWIEQAGGVNVAARASLPAEAQVSPEQLLV